jgi:hypothetical protein
MLLGAPGRPDLPLCARLGRLGPRVGAMTFAVVARLTCQTLLARCPLDKGGLPYGDC